MDVITKNASRGGEKWLVIKMRYDTRSIDNSADIPFLTVGVISGAPFLALPLSAHNLSTSLALILDGLAGTFRKNSCSEKKVF